MCGAAKTMHQVLVVVCVLKENGTKLLGESWYRENNNLQMRIWWWYTELDEQQGKELIEPRLRPWFRRWFRPF